MTVEYREKQKSIYGLRIMYIALREHSNQIGYFRRGEEDEVEEKSATESVIGA